MGPESVSTKRARIAENAREHPERVFTTLNHNLDIDWLEAAYRQTRKDGAPGADGITAKQYERNLRTNLENLLERLKSGTYRAPAVRRVYIPKDDGTSRPLGIPTFEDKVAQRAVVMLLEPLYEQDFHDCSFGFRVGRSAHQALEQLRNELMSGREKWILDIDISNYFGTIDHGRLRTVLDKRVKDGVIRRLIDKWLKAGVLESGTITRATEGTPQGGVISPLLANVFLHEVIDAWYHREVVPRLKGKSSIVRYADDMVAVFAARDDCERVLQVMGKRLEKYGLKLHPTKTRVVDFRASREESKRAGEHTESSFDFLGFTHIWKRSRRSYWIVTRRTAKRRYARAVRRVYDYCKRARHAPLAEQQKRLSRMLLGHYSYYGITGNSASLRAFAHKVNRVWQKWLQRRTGMRKLTWEKFNRLLKRFPLPPARVVHGSA